MARMVTDTRRDTCAYGYKCCSGEWGRGKKSHTRARRALKRIERNEWKKEVRRGD